MQTNISETIREIVKEELTKQSTGQRVKWKVDTTDSGIKLSGSTTVYKEGVILGLIPTVLQNGQQIILFFVKGDDNSHNLVAVDECIYL